MEDKILVIGKRLLGDSDDADEEVGGRLYPVFSIFGA